MNKTNIHSIIVLLLIALTAHEAHSAVAHEVEACEVCIHVQSNNDDAINQSPVYEIDDSSKRLKVVNQHDSLTSNFQWSQEYIRGPPQLSLF